MILNYSDFTYNDISLSNFSPQLTIAYVDTDDDKSSLTRDIVESNLSMNRNVYSAYNTKYNDKLIFNISLVRTDNKTFSSQYMSKITRWLTSPKSYRSLCFIDCDNVQSDIIYYALVTNVEFIKAMNGVVAINVEFTCNAPYGFKKKSVTLKTDASNPTTSIVINNESDELEEYAYPIITIDAVYSAWDTTTITNETDNENTMILKDLDNTGYLINCQYQIVQHNKKTVALSKLFSMSNISKLYWLRLKPGENRIEFSGRSSITITWYEPKKIGAF